jgi:hypothetical protein
MRGAAAIVVFVLVAASACGDDGGRATARTTVTTVAAADLVADDMLRICTGARTDDLEVALALEIAARLALAVERNQLAGPLEGVVDGRCDVAVDRVRVTDAIQARVALLPYVQIDRGVGHVRFAFVLPKGRDSLYFGVRGALSTMNEDGTTKRLFAEAGLQRAHILGMA